MSSQRRPIEPFSPLWVAQKTDAILQRISFGIERLFFRQIVSSVFLIAIAAGIAATTFYAYRNGFGSSRYGYFLLRLRLPIVCCFLALVALCLKTYWVYTARFRVITFAALSAAMAYFAIGVGYQKYLSVFLQILILLFCATVALVISRRLHWKVRIGVFIVTLIFLYFSNDLLAKFSGYSVFEYEIFTVGFPMLLFTSTFLMSQIVAGRGAQRRRETKYLLSHILTPFFLLEPIPLYEKNLPENLPEQNPQKRTANERTSAFLSFFGGAAALFLALFIYRICNLQTRHQEVFAGLWVGWTIYLFYYFFWLGLLRLGYACARLLGYDLPAPASYSLLASDPLERWRRWNRYIYSWFLTAIFLPTSRATGSVLLGLTLVFGVDFFLHNQSLYSYILIYPARLTTEQILFVRAEFLFYFLHALVVALGFLTIKYWPSMRTRRGWLGVFATHLLMAVTHGVVYLYR